MDKPIFGDENRGARKAALAFGGLLLVFALVAIGIGIVIGLLNAVFPLIIHSVLLVVAIALFIIFGRWYKADELDSKFRLVLILLAVLILGMAVNTFLFAFAVKDVADVCFHNETKTSTTYLMMTAPDPKKAGKRKITCFKAPGCIKDGQISSGSCWMSGYPGDCATITYPYEANRTGVCTHEASPPPAPVVPAPEPPPAPHPAPVPPAPHPAAPKGFGQAQVDKFINEGNYGDI